MDPILDIEDLTKIYCQVPNQTKALSGITFQVMPLRVPGDHGQQRLRQVHPAQLYRHGDPAHRREDPGGRPGSFRPPGTGPGGVQRPGCAG